MVLCKALERSLFFFSHTKEEILMENREVIMIHIDTLKSHYPTENYTMLREALDYCIGLLEQKLEEI